MKNTNDEENLVPRPIRIAWTVIKIVLAVALIVMLGWLTLRSCYQDGTKKMKTYMWTDSASEQYENDNVSIYRLTEYNDPKLSRLFFIGRIYYTPEIRQYQFMLRYNKENDSYKDLIEEGAKDFIFELTDKNGNHYTTYSYITDSAMMYGYYRLAFDNVDVTYAEQLVVNIYAVDENGKKISEVGSCIVWQKDAPSQEYKLSNADEKASKPNPDIKTFTW